MDAGATDRPRRVLPPIYFLLSIIAMVTLHYLWPLALWLSAPWRWLGLAAILLGVGVALWGNVLFRRNETTVKPGEVSSSLVVGGPFRFSRNPMYVGMIMVLIGTGLLCGTLSPFFVIPFFVAVIHYRFVLMEEAMLEDAFGEEYSNYMTKVRRWI